MEILRYSDEYGTTRVLDLQRGVVCLVCVGAVPVLQKPAEELTTLAAFILAEGHLVPLQIPVATRTVLENIDTTRQALSSLDFAQQLSDAIESGDLSPDEHKGASAEWAAFFFRPIDDEDASPWNTYYGPSLTISGAQGSPGYIPDLAQIDPDAVAYWETRAAIAKHPFLRARYADLVWDFKFPALGQRPGIQFARIAIDAYLDALSANLYKHAVHALQALRRALYLAVSMKDTQRLDLCKQAIIASLHAVEDSREFGNWAQMVDELLRNKRAGLTTHETGRLVAGLERLLKACTTTPGGQFDPFSAEATARALATHYERDRQPDQVHRVIRAYGMAFEYLAANANATFAMGWLQPVFDEYRSRGMAADADRVLKAYLEKGKHASDDLKTVQARIEIPAAEFEQFLDVISQGNPRECLEQIAVRFVPKVRKIRDSTKRCSSKLRFWHVLR